VMGANYVFATLQNPLVFFGALAGIFVGFRAFVGEYESNTIQLTAAAPITRTEIFLGKVLGRTAGLAVPVTLAILVSWAVGAYYVGIASPVTLVLFTALSLLYVLINVLVAVSFSSVFATSARAGGAAFLYFFVGIALWAHELVPVITGYLASAVADPEAAPIEAVHFLLRRLSPRESYKLSTNWLLGVGNTDDLAYHYIEQLQEGVSRTVFDVTETFGPDPPVFLREWFGLVILGLWIVVLGSVVTRWNNTRDLRP